MAIRIAVATQHARTILTMSSSSESDDTHSYRRTGTSDRTLRRVVHQLQEKAQASLDSAQPMDDDDDTLEVDEKLVREEIEKVKKRLSVKLQELARITARRDQLKQQQRRERDEKLKKL